MNIELSLTVPQIKYDNYFYATQKIKISEEINPIKDLIDFCMYMNHACLEIISNYTKDYKNKQCTLNFVCDDFDFYFESECSKRSKRSQRSEQHCTLAIPKHDVFYISFQSSTTLSHTVMSHTVVQKEILKFFDIKSDARSFQGVLQIKGDEQVSDKFDFFLTMFPPKVEAPSLLTHRQRQKLIKRLHPLTYTADPLARETLHTAALAASQRNQVFGRVGEKRKWIPYDILDTIDHYMDCTMGCYLTPAQQMLLMNTFEKMGYFSTKNKIDTSKITSFRETFFNEHKREAPPPPFIFTHEDYKSLLIGDGKSLSKLLQTASKDYNLIFIVFATRFLGGPGSGSWQCKGNLFSYLLCLYYKIPSVMNKGLVIIDPLNTSLLDAIGTLPHIVSSSTKPLLFCNILDGVYSGNEAKLTAKWAQNNPIPNVNMCFFTAVCNFPNREYPNSCIYCGRFPDGPFDTKIPLVAVVCVPSKLSKGEEVHTNSFLLPFKIADGTSLGIYKNHLDEVNPTFTPSYRTHILCNDIIAEAHPNLHKKQMDARLIVNFPPVETELQSLSEMHKQKRKRGADAEIPP
jgi:hypothetical protein